MTAMILGYWPIRSLCQPIRLLLESIGARYEERHFVTGPAPDYDKSDWLDTRDQLGLDFPNLPFLIDGDVRLTESAAILRYLDHKYQLVSTDLATLARAEMVAGVARDLMSAYISICYSADVAPRIAAHARDRLPRRLRELDRFVRQLPAGRWIAGERPSGVDFLVYEMVDQYRALVPELVQTFDGIAAFGKRIEQLPAIAAYMQSPRFIRHPINNRAAGFGA